MRTEIRALHQRLGTTSIYVTHDQVEAMTMADRIVVLRDGLVEQMGSPTELYDRPINTFVTAFIGSPSMNLLTGTVQNGGVNFDAEFNARLAMPIKARIQDAAKITVGIRPEDFRVVPIGSPGSNSAQVNITEFTGADTQLICSLNGQEVIVVLHERVTAKVGEVIGLICVAEKLHLFDTASGVRL